MKRIALMALPVLLVAALAAAALVVLRRRGLRPLVHGPHVETSDRPTEARAGNAGAGVEVLAGYDERHEEEEEAKHGALLHIDVGRLSVGQI